MISKTEKNKRIKYLLGVFFLFALANTYAYEHDSSYWIYLLIFCISTIYPLFYIHEKGEDYSHGVFVADKVAYSIMLGFVLAMQLYELIEFSSFWSMKTLIVLGLYFLCRRSMSILVTH